jgi:acyl-CoA synthetase (NDP forming)
VRLEGALRQAGVPAYEGLDRAVSALAKLSEYHAFQTAAMGHAQKESRWAN